MAEAMTAAEHGLMSKTNDVNVELRNGLKDSGIGLPGVLGDMNPNVVTEDETTDDACSSEGSGILVTERE